MRTDPTQEPSVLKNIRIEFRELGVVDQNTVVEDDRETGVSVEDPSLFSQDISLDGVSSKEDRPESSEESQRGTHQDEEPEMSEDAALRRAKRSSPEFADLSESEWTGRTGLDVGAAGDRGSLLDGHKLGRSEFKWNRDEGRGNTRQDEPKITSSTFALTGDSAHNHAVVYWSGQNSSEGNVNSF
ncbi:VPS10 domain-containing receptor SorCS1 [Channa argus]|uniref:VPS10 domain-containing receptor SorCS1 n=1 Tax=Channa argus TaxID=215402 RepID=A0A6G1PA08_CHAAH|nr:VPS10 domain-containing receptor SorCS1 [Channa argus]